MSGGYGVMQRETEWDLALDRLHHWIEPALHEMVMVTLAARMRDESSPYDTSADESRFDVPVETGKPSLKIRVGLS
jgi:hypothetical protein